MSRIPSLSMALLAGFLCTHPTQSGGPLAQEPKSAPLAKDEKLETFDYHLAGMKKQGVRRVLTVDLGDGVKLELVRINKGSFKMGAPDGEADAENREKPQHAVD